MVNFPLDIVTTALTEIGRFLLVVGGLFVLLDGYFYLLFHRRPRNLFSAFPMRVLQIGIPLVLLFFLYRMVIRSEPLSQIWAVLYGAGTLLAYGLIYWFSQPRPTRVGLAYLLLLPAVVGVGFLIIFPFGFEVYLAFSNMALGTARNYTVTLENGIQNFVTVFTGTVAHEASFFEVLTRTVLWTAINVTFHVLGGLGLALLLHRPMKLQGFYRTLLVFPWAVPTVIAAMALRNEFDYRYGLFNIVLTGIGLEPISWKQDPLWAFVAVIMSNIWLGIPFMAVILLGGLQSISSEYYEAADIDGASPWQKFGNITLPLLRPVLTPAVILGTVWTFNRLEVIWLITGGGPQEKTDILVSSMYKAAFQFYRYGFTAAFALVIFLFLLAFVLIYLRITGGLKAAWE